MKVTLLLFALTFSASIFADITVTQSECENLAGNIVNESIVVNMKEYPATDEGKKFLKDMTTALHAETNTLCKNGTEIYTIKDLYEKKCKELCKEKSDAGFKESALLTLNREKIRKEVTTECRNACSIGSDLAQNMIRGYIAGKATKGASPDCSGAVSDKGRGVEVKSIEVNLDTRKTTIKTTGK